MSFLSSMAVSQSGLKAQAARIKIAAENIANMDSVYSKNGVEPYRRKKLNLKTSFDSVLKANITKIASVDLDMSNFKLKFDPSNPAADKYGYVKYPNVDSVIEAADSREASLHYEANLNALKQSQRMLDMTIDILRA